MKLRHVLLVASAVGACGALLLAADTYRRLKEAESALLVKSMALGREGAQASVGGALAAGDQPLLNFLAVHALGLLSLAFLFLALFLLLVAALRERGFAGALDGAPARKDEPAPAVESACTVMPLADAAQQAVPLATDQESGA